MDDIEEKNVRKPVGNSLRQGAPVI